SQNDDSLLWFLTLIKTRVVGHRQRVCVISDHHVGILHALDTLHDSEHPATAWPDVERRWCMRHLGANLYTQFLDKRLVMKFKGLCVQNQQSKFNQMWQELNEKTRSMVQAEQTKENALRSQMVEGQTIRSRSRVTFAQWIAQKPAARWALLHDTDGAR